mgnify:CR=1 FL=1
MAAILLPGETGSINDLNITQAGFREQIAAIATAVRRYVGGTSQGVSTTCLYVDPEIGTDDWQAGVADSSAIPPLTNQQITAGYSKVAPFKTLQRALIEAARLSIVSGISNDLYDRVVIRVSPGEHIIDNAPAGSETVSSWGTSFAPTTENLRAFNGSGIGVILPRGVSIVGEDLRKSVIRPSTVPAANLNPSTARGAILKATGGSFFFNFTFKDAIGITTSHHLLSAFEFCSEAELSAFYAKVATAFDLNPADVELINPGETQITTVYPDGNAIPAVDSTRGSSPYVFNCSLRSDYGMCGMFLDGDKVTGFKSMVVAQFTNVSLQKDMNAWETYASGSWNVPASYDAYIASDINNVRYRIVGNINHETGCYDVDYRSFGFKCINNSILQEVSCFVIGDAVHHWTASGGECTITNSNSNFGLTALLSSGFRGIGTDGGAFPQDKGFQVKAVRRGIKLRTDGSNIRQISLGIVDGYNSSTGEITLTTAFDPDTTFGRYGYSLKQGDYLWIENRSRDTGPGYVPGDKDASTAIDVRAQLAATPWDEGTPAVISVNPSSDPAINNITTMDPAVLVGNRVYIRRLVDTRTPAERKYSLIVENSSPSTSRRPVGNFIARLGGRSGVNTQVDPTNGANQLFLVSESSVDNTGAGVSGSRFNVVLRPGDTATSFTAGAYYRAGTAALSSNRIYRAKRNGAFASFSADEWEPSLPMLANERGIESLRIAVAPEIIIDKDLSNDPASTDLGIDQLTDADVLAQLRSSTDYLGITNFMLAIGYSTANVNSVLALQADTASRDWDPSALSSPAPSGKLNSRGYWPLEFNRPSLIRAFGQAYEWAGQGNYSKAMPKYQVTVLSDQHKIDYFAVSHMGGRVYNTGFNEDGLIVQGDTINDLGTNTIVNTETAGLGALSGDPDFPSTPTSFDSLTVTTQFNALQDATFNNITINGVIDGAPTFAPDFLPTATSSTQGIIELATEDEAAAFEDISKAITPAVLSSLRSAADGLASLDSSGKVPASELPVLSASNLTSASTAQKGVIEIATNAEAASYTDGTRALVPSNLAVLRGAADGLASLDASALLPTDQLPDIPLANIPVLTNNKLPLLELAKIPTLTNDKIPLLDLVKIPTLSNDKLPLLELAKIPTLTNEKIPLLNLDRIPTLTNEKIPLLDLDRIPTLTNEKIPLLDLSKIPTLTNNKLPVLELAKVPTLPANKLLTTPVTWTSGSVNFDLSANFTFAHTGGGTLAFGAPTTTGYIGTSGFIYVTNATADALTGIDNAAWKAAVNTWVNPTTGNAGLTGNVIIGYYIAAADTVIYTASMVS